ncbi:MAG: nuclear transport factor 2 family protein [Alphaproteobacteria bacterium]|jgi:hypothetical protein
MSFAALEKWHAFVKSGDASAIEGLLAEDAVFQSPVVHTPQAGRAVAALYLQAAMSLLNNSSFRYLGEWTAERTAVLEFEAVVDGITINGVDMIWWNEEGLITRFKVMIRPLKAINMMHQKMLALFALAKAS